MTKIDVKNSLIKHFKTITEEEQEILEAGEINRRLYNNQNTQQFIIDSSKFLHNESIHIRKHTRFVDFPKHRHNYVEINYVLSGKMVQTVGGQTITLHEGEVVFMNQHIEHGIQKSDADDIIINFIILPEFYEFIFKIFKHENVLERFFIDTLKKESKGQFLHFKVAEVPQIQNLFENMLMHMVHKTDHHEIKKQTFMLIILELMDHLDKLQKMNIETFETILMFETMKYIDENFKDGTLEKLSMHLSQNYFFLSKLIKRQTSLTFKQLLQDKKMSVAASLLEKTDLSVESIADYIGYVNVSYFYRLFQKHKGTTPNAYRGKLKH